MDKILIYCNIKTMKRFDSSLDLVCHENKHYIIIPIEWSMIRLRCCL